MPLHCVWVLLFIKSLQVTGLVRVCFLSGSLRDSWEEGSYFVISTLEGIELLRGTCDFGGEQAFFFFRKLLLLLLLFTPSLYSYSSYSKLEVFRWPGVLGLDAARLRRQSLVGEAERVSAVRGVPLLPHLGACEHDGLSDLGFGDVLHRFSRRFLALPERASGLRASEHHALSPALCFCYSFFVLIFSFEFFVLIF